MYICINTPIYYFSSLSFSFLFLSSSYFFPFLLPLTSISAATSDHREHHHNNNSSSLTLAPTSNSSSHLLLLPPFPLLPSREKKCHCRCRHQPPHLLLLTCSATCGHHFPAGSAKFRRRQPPQLR